MNRPRRLATAHKSKIPSPGGGVLSRQAPCDCQRLLLAPIPLARKSLASTDRLVPTERRRDLLGWRGRDRFGVRDRRCVCGLLLTPPSFRHPNTGGVCRLTDSSTLARRVGCIGAPERPQVPPPFGRPSRRNRLALSAAAACGAYLTISGGSGGFRVSASALLAAWRGLWLCSCHARSLPRHSTLSRPAPPTPRPSILNASRISGFMTIQRVHPTISPASRSSRPATHRAPC